MREKQLLTAVIRELPNIQIRGARGLDWDVCYPQPEFDVDSVLFDLNYFKYCFLKATELEFHELKLEANFRLFAKDLTSEKSESSFIVTSKQEMLCLTMLVNPISSTIKEDEKGHIITMWLRFFGRLRRNIPIN